MSAHYLISLYSLTRNALWFSPGLSAVAPCTSENFNLRLSGPGSFAGAYRSSSRINLAEDDETPPRTSYKAGSYSYHHALTYEASRIIYPGEELVLECFGSEDDWFTEEPHLTLGKFNSNDASYVCLDKVTSHPSKEVGGEGLFAQQRISKGERVIASPVVPFQKKWLYGDGTGSNTLSAGINPYQLMLNYAIGHPESDLMLLPYGPLITYINHPPQGKKANAIITWHSAEEKVASSRRQQYHHPELFEMNAEEVSVTHGKGLMIDIVALTNIGIDEEIYIDYGSDWTKAWENHVKTWKAPAGAETYISADQWFNSQDEHTKHSSENYPDNLHTVCYYDNDAKLLRVDEENNTIHTRWIDDELTHECMRPCKILERYLDPEPDDDEDFLYTAEMMHFEGASKFPFCELKKGTHIAHDITYDGILIVDKPHTTDIFLENAFRHEIGVPCQARFFPEQWLRQKIRRRSASSTVSKDTGSEFKRKKVGEVVTKKMQLKEEIAKEASARADL